MKIVILDADTVGESAALGQIAQLGEFVKYPRTAAEDTVQRIKDAEIVITNKVIIGQKEMDAAPLLKLICVTATGTNNIDLEYAAKKGITVKNVADYSTESVTQVTFMHIFRLLTHGHYWDGFVKDGAWTRSGLFTDISHTWPQLAGHTLGIIGMGKIGGRVAQVASAFGMKVVYFSTSGTGHCTDYPSLPLDELLAVSDIVSIHAPLNGRTRNLIGAEQLEMMKPTAILVNVGRGGIVNEEDLAQALDTGIIAGAGLDVFMSEPIPACHPFLQMAHPERLSLSPHIAWTSNEARDTLMRRVYQNIRDYITTA